MLIITSRCLAMNHAQGAVQKESSCELACLQVKFYMKQVGQLTWSFAELSSCDAIPGRLHSLCQIRFLVQ